MLAASGERSVSCVFWIKIRPDVEEIFIVGDLFDFWYEYRTVVPVRVHPYPAGRWRRSAMPARGIYFFTGNHDMWMKGYFEQELQIPVYHEPKAFEWNGKKFLIGTIRN